MEDQETPMRKNEVRKQSGMAKLRLAVVKREPPKELIEKALDEYAEIRIRDFAMSLKTARALWRSHRELVAPRMPARLKAAMLRADPRVFASMDYGSVDVAEAREFLRTDPFWSNTIIDR